MLAGVAFGAPEQPVRGAALTGGQGDLGRPPAAVRRVVGSGEPVPLPRRRDPHLDRGGAREARRLGGPGRREGGPDGERRMHGERIRSRPGPAGPPARRRARDALRRWRGCETPSRSAAARAASTNRAPEVRQRSVDGDGLLQDVDQTLVRSARSAAPQVGGGEGRALVDPVDDVHEEGARQGVEPLGRRLATAPEQVQEGPLAVRRPPVLGGSILGHRVDELRGLAHPTRQSQSLRDVAAQEVDGEVVEVPPGGGLQRGSCGGDDLVGSGGPSGPGCRCAGRRRRSRRADPGRSSRWLVARPDAVHGLVRPAGLGVVHRPGRRAGSGTSRDRRDRHTPPWPGRSTPPPRRTCRDRSARWLAGSARARTRLPARSPRRSGSRGPGGPALPRGRPGCLGTSRPSGRSQPHPFPRGRSPSAWPLRRPPRPQPRRRTAGRPSPRRTRRPCARLVTRRSPRRPARGRGRGATARPPGRGRSVVRRPGRRGSARGSPGRGPPRVASARRPRRGRRPGVWARAVAMPAVLVDGLGGDQASADGLGEQGVAQLDVVPGGGAEQPVVVQLVQAPGEVGGLEAGHVGQQGVGEGTVGDAEGAGDRPGLRVEALDAPVEQVAEELGQWLVVVGLGGELLGEQRLAGAAVVDAVDLVGADRAGGEHRELLGGLVAGQWPQGQGPDGGQPLHPRAPLDGRGGGGRVLEAPGAQDRYADRRASRCSSRSRVAESAQCRSSTSTASRRVATSAVRIAATAANSRWRDQSSSGSGWAVTSRSSSGSSRRSDPGT